MPDTKYHINQPSHTVCIAERTMGVTGRVKQGCIRKHIASIDDE